MGHRRSSTRRLGGALTVAMLAALLALVQAAPAGAAPATTVTAGAQMATAGGAFVAAAGTGLSVSIDGSGGYDGAGVLSFVGCGNADAAGNPVATPICFDGDDAGTVTFIANGATVQGLAIALAPTGSYAFTYTLLGTGMSNGAGSCIVDGIIPCEVRAVGVDNITDQNVLYQEVISWCLPGGTDGDGDGIPQACDPDDPPPPPPPAGAVFGSDRACAVSPPNPASGYDDVEETDWFARAVAWAKAHGITFGIGDNLFGHDRTATRLEFVQMLHRMGCSPSPGAAVRFTDTSDPAARWAGNVGVVSGVSPGVFGGDQKITRAELFVMLWRAAGSPAATSPTTFSDAQDKWFSAAVAWAQQVGLTNGVSTSMFDPEGEASRAMVVVALLRFHGLLPPLAT